MNGRKVTLDSNIIVYLSKGQLKIEKILERYDQFYISIITYMEVMGYQFPGNEEKKIIKELLENFKIIYINSEIAESVISIRQQHKIKLPDAIILATAKFMRCDLMTRNIKDFQDLVKSVTLVDPFAESQPGIE